MVSKRQKEARKRFKEANPDRFPKPEPTPPKDPSKNKKNKNKNKNKNTFKKPQEPKTLNKSSFRKHPLRVPGMKPGESCFICKAKDHIAKLCPQKSEWEKNKICLLCRRRGHSLKNCPNKNDENLDKKFCYNCGGDGHSLANCTKPLEDGGTKFASCFICNERGHLSKDCPKNTHGVYPKGGCCKICGGITHLAKDCPNKSNRGSSISIKRGGYIASDHEGMQRPKVTKFTSGDDLDDDFMFMDNKEQENKSVESYVKSKRKEAKVVNFVG